VSEPVSDPLKPLDQVLQPDPRQTSFAYARLPFIHAQLSELTLHDDVPIEVRQLYETAKNVGLYTYFVYRFHQVAEMVAIAALEMALKNRAEVPYDQPGPGLRRLLTGAIEKGWITAAGYKSRDRAARHRIEERKAALLWAANPKAESIEVPEATPEEIAAESRPFDFVGALLGREVNGEKVRFGLVDQRNELAHGSQQLHPNSRSTLTIVAETINQLFPAEPPGP
jgi:hypothetical protein